MLSRNSTGTSTTMLLALFTFISSVLAASNSSGNSTLVDGPVFERYQFLSPGIMMGFTVGILLLSILYVGISALSSLEVTYAAFDKESGPGSKKQQ